VVEPKKKARARRRGWAHAAGRGEEDHYIEVTTLFSEWEITVEIQNGGI